MSEPQSYLCWCCSMCVFRFMDVCQPACLFVCFVTPWMWCSISEMRFFVIRIFSGAARWALRADAVLCLIIEFSHCSRYRWQVWVTDFLYTANSSGVCWESSAQRSKEFQSGHRMFWKMPQMFLSPSLHLWCSLNWNRLSSEPNVKTNQWPRWREKAERSKEWMKR